MHRRALLAAGFAALAAPAFAQPVRQMRRAPPAPPPALTGDGAEIASTSTRGIPTVEVMLNGGGRYRFGVETGAAGHGRVSPAVAEALGLPVAGVVMSGDPSGVNRQERRNFAVESLTVGGVTFGGLMLSEQAAIPGEVGQLDGLLGFDLFQGVVLALDYPRSRLRLSRGGLPDPDGRRVLDAGPGGAATLAVQIGEVTLPTHLDTGQVIAPLIVPESLLPRLPVSGEPRVIGQGRTVSQTMRIMGVGLSQPVRVGDLTLPIREAAYPALADVGNLGAQGLAGLLVEIDRSHRRVRLTQA